MTRALFLLLLLGLSACATSLSTTDSFKLRKESLELGNILANPSFEQVATGWSKDCIRQSSNSHTGRYALYVRGKGATCTSPKFAISPGHYNFSTWLKLRSFDLSDERDLLNSLAILVHFYDSSGGKTVPTGRFLGKEKPITSLHSAFRGVSDSRMISELGFHKVHLRPHYYPFDEGWIPENVASIQFEFKLLEDGELWIDDISAKYSKWNFSLKERVQLIDDGAHLIFPNPQKLKVLGNPIPLRAKSYCILANSKERNKLETSIAYADLKLTLDILGLSLKNTCDDSSTKLLRIREGLPASFAKTKSRQESYSLDIKSGKLPYTLSYGGKRGLEYGIQTFFQLFDFNRPFLANVSIQDYPYYSVRSTGGKNSPLKMFQQEIMALRWLPESRINTLFVELESTSPKWWENSYDILAASHILGNTDWHQGLVSYGVTTNPYIDNANPEIDRELILSDPSTIDEIFTVLKPHLQRGAEQVILRADDFVPVKKEISRFAHYLANQRDRDFFGTLGKAHVHLVKRLRAKIKRDFPDTKLHFVPPWYANFFIDHGNSLGEKYLSEIGEGLPKDVAIMWTGQSVRSLKFDRVQASRFKTLLGRKNLMLWDNTLYARRHKDLWQNYTDRVELNSFIEPLDIEVPDDIFPAGVYINSHVTPISRIALATAGAYMWNPKGYHPERTLLAYLKMRFGKALSMKILEFDEQLWQVQRCALGESNCSSTKAKLNDLWTSLSKTLTRDSSGLLEEYRRRYMVEVGRLKDLP